MKVDRQNWYKYQLCRASDDIDQEKSRNWEWGLTSAHVKYPLVQNLEFGKPWFWHAHRAFVTNGWSSLSLCFRYWWIKDVGHTLELPISPMVCGIWWVENRLKNRVQCRFHMSRGKTWRLNSEFFVVSIVGGPTELIFVSVWAVNLHIKQLCLKVTVQNDPLTPYNSKPNQ